MKNYDFIVVGGGSSGSVLASFLASKGPTLLIERGANHTSYPQSASRQGWPQIAAVALKQIRHKDSGHWSGSPSILGGGSALNLGACWRAETSVYESIGLTVEQANASLEFLENRLCEPGLQSEFTEVYEDAWSELGLKRDESPVGQTEFAGWWSSSGSIEGADKSKLNSFQYSRTIQSVIDENQSTTNEILSKRRPASLLFEHDFEQNDEISTNIMNGGNLTVFLLTTAKRIVFDESKTAVGVDVESPAGDLTIYVRNGGKVFLSAGVYETPKLLMLSGIGPRETLEKFKIPQISYNEHVGKNFIDRKAATISIPKFQTFEGETYNTGELAANSEKVWSYFGNKYTPFWGTTLAGCAVCEPLHRTSECRDKLLGALVFYGMNTEGLATKSIPNFIPHRRPNARGYVTLASGDYRDDPVAYDGWESNFDALSNNAIGDLNEIVEGVQDFLSILNSTKLLDDFLGIDDVLLNQFPQELIEYYTLLKADYSNTSAMLGGECIINTMSLKSDICSSWDDCYPTVPPLPRDDQILQKEIFNSLISQYHGVGGCNVDAVVEKGTFAVKNVNSLYIADLSVLNQPVDTHTMLTAMSIGLIVGNSTDEIMIGQYEDFPIVLSLMCIVTVTMLLLALVALFIYNFFKNLSFNRGLTTPELSPIDNDDQGMNPNQHSGVEQWKDNIHISNNHPDVVKMTDSILMSWKHISCSYQMKRKSIIPAKASNQSTTTLHSSFGVLKEGEVTAVMGPSGASKSTLVDILAGRKSIGKITGSCSMLGHTFDSNINGFKGLNKVIMNVSAYIPQQEFFYPTQTPEEAVHFVINLKFGKGNTEARKALACEYLDMVGLPSDKFATRKIGGDLGGGYTIRGLSGGERKRLALACMLALEPKIMFIDELTSGLDSENALMIIKLLKDLSIRKRVASMVIIHQPDPEVFALFDRLILLSKGHTMFSGLCSDLATFYDTNFNESLPSSMYLAKDLITKASTCDPRSMMYQGDQKHVAENMQIQTYNLDPHVHVEEEESPSQTWKLLIVFKRNLSNQYIRNVGNVGARLLSYTMISVIVGMIFWNVGETESNLGLDFEEASLLIRSSIFLMNITYLLPFATIPVFVTDKKFFAAESALGLYSSWMYGVSQLVLEFVFVTLASTIKACIVINMCAMWNPVIPDWVSFLSILAVLIISGLVGSTIILCCSMWLPTQDLAFVLGSTISTISLALCGGFRPVSDMPDVPHTLQWLSPIKYSYQALLIALLTGTSSERLLDIQEYDSPSTVTDNLLVLTLIFVVICVLTSVGMTRVKELR